MTAAAVQHRPRFGLADALRAVAVAAWGLAFGWLLASGRLMTYLSPDLWWLALGGMAIATLFLLGLAITVGSSAFHVHSHPTHAWSRFAIVMFPLAYMVLGPPPRSLGSHDLLTRSLDALGGPVQKRMPPPQRADEAGLPMAPQGGPAEVGTTEASGATDDALAAQAQPTGPPLDMTLLDIAYELKTPADAKAVVTEGMIYRTEKLPEGHAVLFRFVMVCCAADAQPVSVVLAGEGLDAHPEDQWLRVTGVARLQQLAGRERPVLTADKIERIDPPAYPYLSPF